MTKVQQKFMLPNFLQVFLKKKQKFIRRSRFVTLPNNRFFDFLNLYFIFFFTFVAQLLWIMITNKERLEKLIELIKRLEILTEEIRERDIYPVSFFSQAFDVTNKIQEDLQQIEIFQIELIESQMKEHQSQILSTVRQSANTVIPENVNPDFTKPPVQPEPEEVTPAHDSKIAEPIKPTIEQPPQLSSPQEEIVASAKTPSLDYSVQKEGKISPTYAAGEKKWIDLKKVISLNDRFLFCRELFANDEHLMNQIISELNMKESYEDSIGYLKNRFDWDFDDQYVADFAAALKKRFS